MNKKSQVQILGQVFQFGMGIVFLIAMFYFLYDYLIPQIETYALTLQIKNINEHVNYLVSSFYLPVKSSVYSELEDSYSMPDELGDYDYSIYFDEGRVCTQISSMNLVECIYLTVQDATFDGIFFSGGDMTISVEKYSNETTIRIKN